MSKPQQTPPTNGAAGAPEVQPQRLEPGSARFIGEVERQFESAMGAEITFSEHQRRLAQHLFVKVTSSLKAHEENRVKKNQTGKKPFTWENVDRTKLAVDAVHRIALGLDGLMSNHIHVVPYWDGKQGLYWLDLRIGYKGKDLVVRTLALDPPRAIRYKLVHATDEFEALPADADNEVETYRFKIRQAFARGDVIGGFGYLVFEDPLKNVLHLVDQRDFDRAKGAAQTDDFWATNDVEMKFKTLVHRVTDEIALDPKKVNASVLAVLGNSDGVGDINVEVAQQANRQLADVPTVDADPPTNAPADGLTEEDKAEALRREAAEGELFERDKVQARRGPGY